MKKSILTVVALGVAVNVMGQGIVNFSSRVLPDILAHVYGAQAGNPVLTGNSATEAPVGSQVYLGALLAGTGFSAQLFSVNLINQAEGSLVAVPGITTFRTGSVAGTFAAGNLTIPNVAGGGSGTFQVRAWDNVGGTINSYALAVTRGKSDLFNINLLGDGALILPADMALFRSFNLQAVPEPSTFVLAGLGAAALLIFRRRK